VNLSDVMGTLGVTVLLPTPWNRFLLEKLVVAELVKKFPALY